MTTDNELLPDTGAPLQETDPIKSPISDLSTDDNVVENDDDLHEIRVGDDVNEPDPEDDSLRQEPAAPDADDEDPVPSPS